MKPFIIAHRANLEGPDPKTENTPEAIQKCIEAGIDIELDIWYKDGKFFLGHDEPKIEFDIINYNFYPIKVFVHCKTIETYVKFKQKRSNFYEFSAFIHDKDMATLTSDGNIWTYPGQPLFKESIAVMPEYVSKQYQRDTEFLFKNNEITGVCSDYPLEWKELLQENKENEHE